MSIELVGWIAVAVSAVFLAANGLVIYRSRKAVKRRQIRQTTQAWWKR